MAAKPAELSLHRAIVEYERRERAKASLVEFARAIEIPGVPIAGSVWDDAIGDEAGEAAAIAYMQHVVFAPIESKISRLHVVMLEAIQACMQTFNGRLLILAPPGSAKSTYVSVVAPAWGLGKWPRHRYIMTSYATKLARKHSRRVQAIARQDGYRVIWDEQPELLSKRPSSEEWGLSNGSDYMAAGILAGITGNRAHGVFADDLIAGREEADSPVVRTKIMEAYRDDLESRLFPGGFLVLINTRWHQDDPAGQLLPRNWKGESGPMKGSDGRDWYVLNIPAKCERADDPVGRAIGEYLWPEWFPKEHWQAFENDPLGRRRWGALYQQNPTAAAGDDFKLEDARFYEPEDLQKVIKRLRIYGASDWAVQERDPNDEAIGKVDFTEHGIFGFDPAGNLWMLDWWSGQKATDVSLEAWIALVKKWKPLQHWHEGGTIDKAIGPFIRRAMREHQAFTHSEALVSMTDKRAKCQAFAVRHGARTVYWPAGSLTANEVLEQLTGFPGHRFDDKYDVCGLIGRGIDKMIEVGDIEPPGQKALTPFTDDWLTFDDDKPKKRYR